MEGLLAAAALFGARRRRHQGREQATARRLQERRPRSIAERDDRPPEAARGDGDGVAFRASKAAASTDATPGPSNA